MKIARNRFFSIVQAAVLLFLFQAFPTQAEENGADRETNPGNQQDERWNLHFQSTVVTQGHSNFSALYSGTNSISPSAETATSFSSTLYLGGKLGDHTEFYINPELLAGSGVSSTLGLAGAPNGEIYRVDDPHPEFNLSRIYLKEIVELGGGRETFDDDLNQLAASYDIRRVTISAGKFSLVDFFDHNRYSDDPRTQFLNWSIMYNGAWDFAADTRGYTWGAVLELFEPGWSLRYAIVQVPEEANQMKMDGNLAQAHSQNLEWEARYRISSKPGALRVIGFANSAHMGNYRETIINPVYQMNITQDRQYRVKYGFGTSLEQQFSPDFGGSLRIGWNDGSTETWAFTEIDRTASLVFSLKGSRWQRPEDNLGIGLVINGLSEDHADYLAAGGYGFIIGDGRLNYAPEEILEVYYAWNILKYFTWSPDFQFVNHPAYNQDRGPVYLFGIRLHFEI